MRIRTIKPAFWTSEDIAALHSDTTRLLFIGLWNYCDDEGRGADNAALIRAALFPLDDRTLASIEQELCVLASMGHVCRYVVNGRKYLHVPTFSKHQVINRRTASSLPECPLTELHVSGQGVASVHSHLEGKGREGNKEGEGNSSVNEPAPVLALVVADVSPTGDPVQRIFTAWQQSTGKTKARLSDDRRKLIARQLKAYAEADLIDAVQGWKNDPFYCGQNDRNRPFNDIGLLLRDAKNIEMFRDLHRTGPTRAPRISRTTQTIANRIAELEAGANQ